MVWPPNNPMVSTLTDEFDANSLDTSKWYHYPGPDYPIAFNDNGRLRLNGTVRYGPDVYWATGHLESQISNYNIDSMSVRLQPPDDLWDNDASFNGTWNGTFEARGGVVGSYATSWGFDIQLEQSYPNQQPFGTIRSGFYFNGGETSRVDNYSYTDHAYLRIRSLLELNTSGFSPQYLTTFFLDTSPDGVTWLTQVSSLPQQAPYMEHGFKPYFYNRGGYMWLDHFRPGQTNLKVRLENNTWKDVPLPQVRSTTNTWVTPPNMKVRMANNTWKAL